MRPPPVPGAEAATILAAATLAATDALTWRNELIAHTQWWWNLALSKGVRSFESDNQAATKDFREVLDEADAPFSPMEKKELWQYYTVYLPEMAATKQAEAAAEAAEAEAAEAAEAEAAALVAAAVAAEAVFAAEAAVAAEAKQQLQLRKRRH